MPRAFSGYAGLLSHNASCAPRQRVREASIPRPEVPTHQELPERLDAVLQAIYLVADAGSYSAAAGVEVTRAELTDETIRLGRMLAELQPEPEAISFQLALILLQESRRAARTSPAGELILLPDQDRSLWNREQIVEGVALVEKALSSRRFGPYTLQAAIAAVHAEAESATAADWQQIVALYNQLVRIQPSPVVHLNRAVVIAANATVQRLVWRTSKHWCSMQRTGELLPGALRLVQSCAAG